jgi:hypothetical protein
MPFSEASDQALIYLENKVSFLDWNTVKILMHELTK